MLWENYILLMTICDFLKIKLFEVTNAVVLKVLLYFDTSKTYFFVSFLSLGNIVNQGSINMTERLGSRNIGGLRPKTKLFL